MFINSDIEFVFDEAHFELFYTSEVPQIKLIYENDTLSIKDRKDMKMFSIGRNHFVMKGGKLYNIDSTIHPDIIPLINTLYIRNIDFNTKLYNEFFTYIYPKTKDLINIVNRDEFEKHNNCSTLETNCYLDLNDGVLSLKYHFL